MSDPWAAHRAAISVEEGADAELSLRELLLCHDNDIEGVVSFLVWHGLAGIWSEALSERVVSAAVARSPGEGALNEIRVRLSSLHRQQLAHQLMQDAAMRLASDALNREAIAFVWLKAAAIRNELYPRPGLRPSTDLDLLVAPADRNRAFDALASIGGTLVASESASAHEQVVRLRSVDLDVHWYVLAPGRLRDGVTEELLRDRVVTEAGARPSNQHMIALALIHPAFAKHVCSRHMGLNRVADTLRMLRAWNTEAYDLVKLTERWGGLTAARASLYWLSKISNSSHLPLLNGAFNTKYETWRDRYLARRIDQNWPDWWVDRSRFVLGLTFSVWLQDKPIDALRALLARTSRARRSVAATSAAP
jgi:Uncharacterised nucleotidyltransferase